MSEWYYDVKTKEVTEGKQKGFEHRMGPYDSKEEAEAALDIAHSRTEQADEWDKEEDED